MNFPLCVAQRAKNVCGAGLKQGFFDPQSSQQGKAGQRSDSSELHSRKIGVLQIVDTRVNAGLPCLALHFFRIQNC